MAVIKEIHGTKPTIGNNCFLAETAAIIGDVTMGDNCSIWYGTVLRGDVNTITIGNNGAEGGCQTHKIQSYSIGQSVPAAVTVLQRQACSAGVTATQHEADSIARGNCIGSRECKA